MKTVEECYRAAAEELKKITCFRIPTQMNSPYTNHSCVDGCFYEQNEGDRGEKFTIKIGSAEELVSYLIYKKICNFAYEYELYHRRKFEDSRRQVNEIIVRCYEYLGDEYEYRLMSNLSDNISIYLGLLEHYVMVCNKLTSKRSIPQETMRRIKFVAHNEYASTKGGMHDVAFTLDYVRFNIAEIIKAIPFPALEEEFMQHEGQFKRLLKLEKERPCQKDRYPLGLWSNEVFREAEEMLGGKRLKDGEPLRCALYLLMNAVQIDRASGLYIELCFHKDIDITKYRAVLEEMFVADKYSVYFFGPTKNFSQQRKDKLSFKLLER